MSGDIAAKLVLDIQGAIKSIETFSSEGKKSFGSIEQSVGNLQKAIGAVASAFAFEKIKAGFEVIIDASAEAEKSYNSMVNALKLSNSYSDSAVRSFERLAEEIQNTTTFDDDAVLGQVALAKSFNTTNKEAEKLIKAAVELSAYTGQDLTTSVSNLGKTLDGSLSGKLAESIPGIKQFTAEQLRMGAAVEFVLKRFGGSAAAATNTYSGAMSQAKNAVSNLAEAFGDLITKDPLIIKLIKSVTEFTKKVQESESLKRLILSIAAGIATLGVFAAGLAAVSAALAAASVAAGVFGVSLSIAIWPVTAIAAALSGLVAAFVFFQKRANETSLQKVNREFDEASEKVKNLQALIKRYEGMSQEKTNSVSKSLAVEELPKLKEQLAEAEEAMRKLGSAAVAQGRETGKSIENDIGGASKRAAIAAKEAYVKYLDKIKGEYETLKEKIGDLGLTEEQRILKTYSLEQRKLDELLQNKIINEKQYSDFATKLAVDRNEKLKMADSQRIQKLTSNPFEYLFDPKNASTKFGGPEASAGGLYLANTALQGAQGAKALVQSLAGAGANILLPGSGAVVSQIVGALAEGPEKVKEMVRQFVAAVPQIIKAIIQSIPVLIKELAKGFKELVREIPAIVEAFIEEIPNIIEALVEAMPEIAEAWIEMSPKMIEGMFRGLGKLFARAFGEGFGSIFGKLGEGLLKIPATILKALSDGIQSIFSNISIPGLGGGGGGGGLGGLLGLGGLGGLGGIGGGIGGIGIPGLSIPGLGGGGKRGAVGNAIGVDLPFAEGGLVPFGFPNDTFPARLSSHELVLPPKPAKTYQEVMGDGPESLKKKLDQMTVGGGGAPQQLTVNLQLGEKNLATAIMHLDERGFRLRR